MMLAPPCDRPGAAETSEASGHRYLCPCMPPLLPPFMAPFMPPAPPPVPLMSPLARISLPPKKPPLLPPATPPEGFWRFWNAPPAAPDSGSPTSPPPAVNAINAVGARKRAVNARISLRMALPPYGKHMGNSQSARRFPTLKHARARHPFQEGQAKKLSCVAIAADSTLAEGPSRAGAGFFSGGNPLEESRT